VGRKALFLEKGKENSMMKHLFTLGEKRVSILRGRGEEQRYFFAGDLDAGKRGLQTRGKHPADAT